MSMSTLSGHGVRIVKIAEANSYTLDEEALANILLNGDVRDCPVVVISVAGAYRGGKSFLLGFLLRYLIYVYCKKNGVTTNTDDEAWLGDPDSTLEGFSWRGGSSPDTSGLLLWSQPIYVTRPNGTKVAVLLMDTQGAFDHNSTMRDNSTVFALSTLVSSVQIYNLSQKIQETDLQFLQSFIQYGKIASRNGNRAFQKLMFLIRDWPYPYEHKYGAEGGRDMLRTILQVKPNQVSELSEVREYITSCFEFIDCFLMPLPGMNVIMGEHFKGKLTDIDKPFLKSLNELVHLLLEPQHLIVKSINGQEVKGCDLFHYIKTYMDNFKNGDFSPESLHRASIKAAILTTFGTARRKYISRMDDICGECQPSMTPGTLEDEHKTAHDAAVQHLRRVIECVNPESDDVIGHPQLTELIEELNNMLPNYKLKNKSKLDETIKLVKNEYTNYILTSVNVCEMDSVCLHPNDLLDLHRNASPAAVSRFDQNRLPPKVGRDYEKDQFVQELESQFSQIQTTNNKNNEMIVTIAVTDYCSYMKATCGESMNVSRRVLEQQHHNASCTATDYFRGKRNLQTNYSTDRFETDLNTEINTHYARFVRDNEESDRTAVDRALALYNSHMEDVCSTHLPCVHPDELEEEHEEAEERAINEFRSSRMPGIDDDEDDDDKLQRLRQQMAKKYSGMCNMNERNNRAAVRAAVNACRGSLQAACGEGLPRVPEHRLEELHDTFSDDARRHFKDSRRNRCVLPSDVYTNQLDDELEELLTEYRAINRSNSEAQNNVVARQELPVVVATEQDESGIEQIARGVGHVAAGTAKVLLKAFIPPFFR